MNKYFELVAHLDQHMPHTPETWHEWRIEPITGGANNVIFRATNNSDDLTIKFTVRDSRSRAGREYAALRALEEAGTTSAPRGLWLEQTRFRQPVVVQTWLEGQPLEAPPQDDSGWQALLDHYCTIHTVTPSTTTVVLAEATVNAASVEAGKALIAEHLARIPRIHQPKTLRPVLQWLEAWQLPIWQHPARVLCRVDSNPRNFINRAGGFASVDWENSGWGDGAFEWADMITHPAYADCNAPWNHLIATYATRTNDTTAPKRIAAYTTIMAIWWMVRWARYLYEVPRGLDQRLAAHPANWQARAEAGYERSLAQARARM